MNRIDSLQEGTAKADSMGFAGIKWEVRQRG